MTRRPAETPFLRVTRALGTPGVIFWGAVLLSWSVVISPLVAAVVGFGVLHGEGTRSDLFWIFFALPVALTYTVGYFFLRRGWWSLALALASALASAAVVGMFIWIVASIPG